MEHLRHLTSILRVLATGDSLDAQLSSVLRSASETLPLRTAVVVTVGESGNRADWRARGVSADKGRAAQRRALATLAWFRGEKRALPRPSARSLFISVPLATGPRVFGLLQLEVGVGLDDEDLSYVNAVAHQLGVAVDEMERRVRDECLRRASETVRELAAVVAHDLKTPLAAIRLHSARLGDRPAPPPRRVAIAIGRLATQIQTRLNDLLDAERRIASNAFAVRPRRMAALAAIGDALAIVDPLAQERAIRIVVAGRSRKSQLVGDRARVTQVLVNLLENSLRFAPRGGTITVRVKRIGRAIEIAVEDDGPGIPASERKHLFEARWRGARARGPGSGLGLYIARRLIEAQGGRIRMRARARRGCTFAFTLAAA